MASFLKILLSEDVIVIQLYEDYGEKKKQLHFPASSEKQQLKVTK